MKTPNKFLLSAATVLMLVVCASWTPATYRNALTDYLAKTDFVVNEKADPSALEKLLKCKVTPRMKKNFAKKTAAQFLTPQRATPTSPVIYYYMYEQPTPYMDANLKISVDYTQVRFEFWSIYDSYATNSEGAFIELVEPIFIPWDASGYYHITITSYDGTNWANVFDQTYPLDPSDTPDYSSYYQSFYADYGYDYYIYVTAASFA